MEIGERTFFADGFSPRRYIPFSAVWQIKEGGL
jgi:hypothetical protein